MTNEYTKIRKEKIASLESEGIPPYPNKYDRTHTTAEAMGLKLGSKKVKMSGRLMLFRDMGRIAFGHIQDGSGKMQIVLNQKEIKREDYKFFVKNFDIGDFIGVEGEIFRTKKGEKTLLVKKYTMLSKSLRPLPEKWHGLKDEDLRYRKRYLDLIMNPEIKDIFVKKSKFWNSIRSFMIKNGFLEVETPVLETTAGGADAKPFETHHNALDIDVYLRISCGELWQKKLMVGGFEKVFEIGRIFRNEGMDAEHAQDYTQMEFYWAYSDYKKGMKFVEELYKYVAKETFGKQKFEIGNFKVDLGKKWKTYNYVEIIKEKTGIDVLDVDSIKTIQKRLDKLGVKYDKRGFNLNRGIDNLWKYCRKSIGGPGFLINVPVRMEPLAKRDPENKKVVERFQVLIAGSEVGKGYSELNDPIDQAERFDEQAKLREAGDDEAQMYDHSFVEALEYGMPPTFGFGVSERLFSFLMDKSIRECQIFPLMKPEK